MKITLSSILVAAFAATTAFAQVEVCEPSVGLACADGAFRKQAPRACDVDWTYRDVPAGITKQADPDGCLSITEFPPFGLDDPSLVDPKDSRTDKTRWCSFKQNKNQGAGNTIYDVKNDITSWGYCLTLGSATGGNSTTGTTAPSGSTGATAAPTPLSLPAGAFLADGGFQETPFVCDTAWTYSDADGVVSGPFTGCVSGDKFEPSGWNDAGLIDPKDARTNTSLWCSVKQGKLGSENAKYDLNAQSDRDAKLQAWGFCLDTSIALVTTETPTKEPETLPTTSPVPGPSASPTPGSSEGNSSSTEQPSTSTTMAPSGMTGETVSPTMEPSMGSGENVTGSPNPSPSGLSSGEIAAAVVVPLIVVFGAIGGFAYYKYSSLNESGAGAGAGYAEAGTTEPETAKEGMDTGKPVTEATEGKKNADEILLG